jgi:hypothetical protein
MVDSVIRCVIIKREGKVIMALVLLILSSPLIILFCIWAFAQVFLFIDFFIGKKAKALGEYCVNEHMKEHGIRPGSIEYGKIQSVRNMVPNFLKWQEEQNKRQEVNKEEIYNAKYMGLTKGT